MGLLTVPASELTRESQGSTLALSTALGSPKPPRRPGGGAKPRSAGTGFYRAVLKYFPTYFTCMSHLRQAEIIRPRPAVRSPPPARRSNASASCCKTELEQGEGSVGEAAACGSAHDPKVLGWNPMVGGVSLLGEQSASPFFSAPLPVRAPQ